MYNHKSQIYSLEIPEMVGFGESHRIGLGSDSQFNMVLASYRFYNTTFLIIQSKFSFVLAATGHIINTIWNYSLHPDQQKSPWSNCVVVVVVL
jgi:hypothetical protein